MSEDVDRRSHRLRPRSGMLRSVGTTAVDWLGAVGTAVALLIGVFVLAREQRDRRRAQARQVNAWAVEILPKRDVAEVGPHTAIVAMDGSCVVVEAVNNSSEPVYAFHVWVRHNLAPGTGGMGSHERRLLPPGSHRIHVDGVQIPEGGLADWPPVDVTFKDSGGRRWQRLHTGDLGRDRLSPEGRSRLLRYRLRGWWRRTKPRVSRVAARVRKRAGRRARPTPPRG